MDQAPAATGVAVLEDGDAVSSSSRTCRAAQPAAVIAVNQPPPATAQQPAAVIAVNQPPPATAQQPAAVIAVNQPPPAPAQQPAAVIVADQPPPAPAQQPAPDAQAGGVLCNENGATQTILEQPRVAGVG